MPVSAPRPCRVRGCKGLVQGAEAKGYCDAHGELRSNWTRHQARKGNTTERGYGAGWRKIRARVLKRDAGLCQVHLRQGFTVVATEVDHIVQKADGGTDEEHNLQAICGDCHREKTARESRG